MKLKKTSKLLSTALLLLALAAVTGCSNNGGKGNLAEMASGDMKTYESTAVNGVEQARPTIMVIPGDETLKNFKFLTIEKVNGREHIMRDFPNYLLKDYRARPVISHIQDAFIQQGYPLNDFEQTLKQLNTQDALDAADDLEKDSKTLLLTTAHPDIILELNYYSSKDKNISLISHDYGDKGDRDVSYTLSAIDAYSNKVVATIGATGLNGKSTTQTLQSDIDKKMSKFQQDIIAYFSDLMMRGRDITVRVSIEKGADIELSDESIEGDTYADWVVDYVKTHTVKGAYNLQRNTDKELYFVNCRIKLLNEDGTQYGSYDFARDLQKTLRNDLGLKVANKSQGLGEVHLVIEGLK